MIAIALRTMATPSAGLALGALLLVACRENRPALAPHMVSRTHLAMGSEVRVSVWTPDEGAAEKAMVAAFAEFDRLDGLFSVWKPASDVLRLNAAAGRAPVRVSPATRDVLRQAHELSVRTAGKFDVTFGALSDVWKFDHDQDNRIPTAEEIAARVPLVDYRAVVVDESAGTAFVSRPGMRIHLGGIGKGYAVDRAVDILRRAHLRDFMVHAGGDLFVSGQPGDAPWRLGINDPRGGPDESFATVELHDRTFSTSGDYERFFVRDGTRYHHLLDPDTGQPARGCVSVTIVARTATVAEGYSKGVFILGPKAGMALVERVPDLDAVIVTAANEVLISSGLQGRVRVHRVPTAARP
ncbi:MAG: FAD:protein FMN transferase [Acidobacteria bacterium]|nr:FAD:protein FMN transferase [Acidobacteriota bacterium]